MPACLRYLIQHSLWLCGQAAPRGPQEAHQEHLLLLRRQKLKRAPGTFGAKTGPLSNACKPWGTRTITVGTASAKLQLPTVMPIQPIERRDSPFQPGHWPPANLPLVDRIIGLKPLTTGFPHPPASRSRAAALRCACGPQPLRSAADEDPEWGPREPQSGPRMGQIGACSGVNGNWLR